MTDFRPYRRTAIAKLAPWTPETDMSGVSVSEADLEAGSPKPGDMIARNPKNHDDKWLVAAQYFRDNFEPLAPQKDTEVDEEVDVAGKKPDFWIFFNEEGPYGAAKEPALHGSMIADPENKKYWQEPAFSHETVKQLEQERDEARERAKMYNLDMMRVREERDGLVEEIRKLRAKIVDLRDMESMDPCA